MRLPELFLFTTGLLPQFPHGSHNLIHGSRIVFLTGRVVTVARFIRLSGRLVTDGLIGSK